MSSPFLSYMAKQGHQLVEESLRALEGIPVLEVEDDATYKLEVIEPVWAQLPASLRLLWKQNHNEWIEFYHALRARALDLSREHVRLKPDLASLISECAHKQFGQTSNKDSVPVAKPVTNTASHSIPKAEAVQSQTKNSPPLGIDLGTTYSVVAYVNSQGQPTSILNESGERMTPSVVLFDEEGVVVGKEAVQASAMEPEKVADCPKRDMGSKAYRKLINGESLPPEVISSFILKSLKHDAERLFSPAQEAVITVPAYFDDARRSATIDAGRLAGLEVLDIINEPTAAAFAYGYKQQILDKDCKLTIEKPLRSLVYDLGGGTFDVTIVEIDGSSINTLATDGDVVLGGRDWDEILVDLVAERFRQEFREDPRDNPISCQQLWLSAETAKCTLSQRQKAAVYVSHCGTTHKIEVTRQEFEDVTAPLLERTRMTTELVLKQTQLTWEDIDNILLVGGATRMPGVIKMLRELTGKDPDRSISPDEAVAHGAALYAAHLKRDSGTCPIPEDFSVTNVTSHSLGIRGTDISDGHRMNTILIPKNSPLPRTATRVFQTFKENQRNVVIRVLEGESSDPSECSQLGSCKIQELPENLPQGWPIEVTYSYKADGRVHVAAKVKGHNCSIQTNFYRENCLPEDDLELWAYFIQKEMKEAKDKW